MDVRIIPGFQSNASNLKFNWTFVNYTDSVLVIHLNFERPERVSIYDSKELISITIYANYLFVNMQGSFLPQGFDVRREQIVQITRPKKEIIDSLGRGVGTALIAVLTTSFVVSIFLGCSLSTILGAIE